MVDRAAETGGNWEQRPVLSRSIRVLAFIVPIVGSMATGYVLTAVLPPPSSTAWGVVRWLFVAIASAAALVGAERIARRLIPLSTLFKLTLAFPDTVPSRLGLAMRVGTTMQLKRRIEQMSQGPVDETPGQAARRLLELVGLLSRHDRMTRGHSERVRALTHVIGTEMGIDGRELEQLRWSALLHDVGKIRVPTEILNKPGRLTDEEFDIIKTHPMAGKECVEPLAEWLGDSVRAVWEHHERFDGGGYPQGLSGSEIARASRIVCVADAYDVMTSTRSYKKPMSGAHARSELSKHAGTQFDPTVVRAFLTASIGVPSMARRRSTWLSQAALLPQAVVRRLGPTVGSAVAAGTVAAVGAVGGSVGSAMADTTSTPTSSIAQLVEIPDDSPPDEELPPAITAAPPSSSADPTTTSPRSTPDEPNDSAPQPPPPPDSTSSSTTTVAPSTATTTVPITPPGSTTTTVVPDVTLPTTTAVPDVTVPDVTVPDVTVPDITIPDVTIPDVTITDVTIPDVTVPDVTVPEVPPTVTTLPAITVPPVTLPDVPVTTLSVPDVGF